LINYSQQYKNIDCCTKCFYGFFFVAGKNETVFMESTHSEYAIVIAFPWRPWLRERTSVLRYT